MIAKRNILYLFILCCLQACYDDIDESQVVEPTENIPVRTNDGSVIVTLKGNDQLYVPTYKVEVNDEIYDITPSDNVISLQRVKRYHQEFTFWIDGEEVAFANVPVLEGDTTYVTANVYPEVELIDLSSSQGAELSIGEAHQINVTAENIQAAGISTITMKTDRSALGYLGELANGSRVVLNHLNTVSLESETKLIASIKEHRDSNASVFVYNEAKQIWQILTDGYSKILELPCRVSIAEYVPASITVGSAKVNDEPIVFQPLEISNPSTDTYHVWTTSRGRYVGFLAESGGVISRLDCMDTETHMLDSSIEESTLNLNWTVDVSAKSTVDIVSFGCDNTLTTADNIIVNVGDAEVPFVNGVATLSNICGQGTEEATLTAKLDDGELMNLPWRTDIQDSIIYMPRCATAYQGYALLQIRDDVMQYSDLKVEMIDGNMAFSDESGRFTLLLRRENIGGLDVAESGMKLEDPSFGDKGYAVSCIASELGCGLDYCQITHNDDQWFRVSFAGKVWMQTLTPRIAGNYEVKGNIVLRR